jgi:competence protein ComEC
MYLALVFGVIALGTLIFSVFVSRNKWGILMACFAITFSCGVVRFQMRDVAPPQIFESYVGEKVRLVGEVVDEPELKENNKKINIEVDVEGEIVNILASVNLVDDVAYGDELVLEGKLEKPANFITEQGKEFDYINYLRKDNILYLIDFPKVEITSRGNGNFIKSYLFSIKEKFLEKVNFAIRSPESLLMGGLILGEKSSFDESLRQSFVDTGTIHIIALSGYNITIVAEWFMRLFVFLPIGFATFMGMMSVILFILMTGASSTAIRAGIMAGLALYARASGRNYDVARVLLLAAVLMILVNPFLLVFDVSFQLSFIATVAVIFLAPRVEKYFLWVPEKFGLRDIIAVTFAAYIFVLPFVLYKMGNLSLVALPANILVLPFIPFTMILGFATGILGLVFYILAVPVGYISYLFLHYELGVISFLSHVPFAALSFPNFPLWLTLIIYLYFIYRLFGGVIKKFFTKPF